MMLKFLRYAFATVGMVLVIYSFITENYESQPFLTLCLGLMFFVLGLEERQKDNKSNSWIIFGGSFVILFVTVQGFLLRYNS